MYEHYHGLIFDMDGTILDTEPTHLKAWCTVLANYHIPYNEQAIVALSGSPTWRIAKAIIDLNNVSLDPIRLANEKAAVLKATLFDYVEPLPLIEVVKTWYGRRQMAVGTGSERALAEALLNHLNIRHYFDVVVTADDVGNPKPAPDTFLRCAALLGVEPEKCIVFEDADFGLQAARLAGMDAVDVRLL